MTKTAAMTQAEQAQLDAVLRAIQTMTDKHCEFEAAMHAGDEQAVRAALQACTEASHAWVRTPSDTTIPASVTREPRRKSMKPGMKLTERSSATA